MKKDSINLALNILIVEDSLSFALELEMMIKEMGYQVAGRVDSAGEAFEQIYTLDPDLILMDIDLKGKMTGIDIAQKIKHLNIPILYITSWGAQEYYEKAKMTNLIGYLVKPVERFTLLSAIEQAFKKLSAPVNQQRDLVFPTSHALFFKKKQVLHKVEIKEIHYIKADDNYTIIKSDKGDFISALNLAELHEILTPYDFFKTHRSYLVNLTKIDTIDIKDGFLSIQGKEIPISRTNKGRLVELLNVIK